MLYSCSTSTLKRRFFYILLLSLLNSIYCDSSSNEKKILILLILLIIIVFVVIFLILIFVYCCYKKRDENRNIFFERYYLQRGNAEEIQLRQRCSQNKPKALSDYLKENIISDKYNKKFEIFGTQCPICLENYEENKSIIFIGGCLHIFHQKCLSQVVERIDITKNIISQYTCPTCRTNLFADIDKIKNCIQKFPNFFDDIYKNKEITKITHIKNFIDTIFKQKDTNSIENIFVTENNVKIFRRNNTESDRRNIK